MRTILISLGAIALASAAPGPEVAAPVSAGKPGPNARAASGQMPSMATPAAPPHGEGHDGPEWGYAGPGGPDRWADLAEDYRICARGEQESPIDLVDPIPARLGKLDLSYEPLPLTVRNTGHSIQVDGDEGGAMRVGGRQYNLVQAHFHHPSEHLLNGRRYPMEAHFVHRRPDGVLGVIAVFFTRGRPNAALEPIVRAIPAKRGEARPAGATFRASDLIPRNHAFFRYEGSLTTPPCAENVDWVVLTHPVEVSPAQVEAFKAVIPFNARPIQKLNRRFLLRSD